MEIYKNLSLTDLSNEIWKWIKFVKGYQISNFGRVKSFKRKTIKILKQNKNNHDYLYVNLSNNKIIKHYLVHRLVASEFIGNVANFQVNHIDGNKFNNCVSNIEIVNQSQNMKHSFEYGLNKRGENHYLTNLTNDDVRIIKMIFKSEEFKNGNITLKYISEYFHVSEDVISFIKRGKSWNHIKNDIDIKLINRLSNFLSDLDIKRCGRSKLSKNDIISINMYLNNSTLSHKKIADIFGVSKSTISRLNLIFKRKEE